MHALARIATRYSRWVIAVFILLTAFFAYQARYVTMTTDIRDFFPADDPRVESYRVVEEQFGSADHVMVAVETDDVFTPAVLQAVQGLTEKFENLTGLSDVRSITNISEIKGTDWGIEVAPLLEALPASPHDMAIFQSQVMADPLYRGTFVSDDGKATLVVLELDPAVDNASIVADIERIANGYSGPGRAFVTGTPVLNKVLVDSMKSDLRRLLPIVLLIIAVVLFLYFRSFWGTLLPFVTVLVSVVWTLGTMSLLHKPLSPLSAVLPVILISLGTAYAIYILSQWNDENGAQHALQSIGPAVVMAGATTIAGFASNATSPIALMQDFGLFAALGIFIALITALLLVPAVVTHVSVQRRSRGVHGAKDPLDLFLTRINRWVVRSPKVVVGVGLGLFLLGAVGVFRISTDSNFFNFFDPSSQPRQAYELVKDGFGGSETIEVVVNADMTDPQILSSMDQLEDVMRANPGVTHPFSAPDILKQVDSALNPDGVEGNLPSTAEAVAQYYLLLEMDADNMLGRFVNLDYTSGRIQARVNDTSADGTQAIVADLQGTIRSLFRPGQRVQLTGIVILMDALADLLVQSQLWSLIVSMLMVFAIVRWILGSWEGSFLSTGLIGLVTLTNFGLMGWFGIPLDIVTVLISSIGVGVGIDYGIHMYSAYLSGRKDGLSHSAAWQQAISTRGRAIVTNAEAVVAGFVVLAGSSFPPLRYFGILVTGVMGMASFAALTLLPASALLRRRQARKVVVTR